MKLSLIRIKKIMGIEDLEIKIKGKITVIEGRNATGKSSIMAAIDSMLGGGHDASLLRRGEKEAKIVFLLDDGVELSKHITPNKSEVNVTHPNLGPLKKTQTFINRLVDAVAVNPIKFVRSSPAEQIRLLMETLPVSVDRERLEKLAPDVKADPSQLGLPLLDDLSDRVYKERTVINRIAKDKNNTADQLKSSLPPPVGLGTLPVHEAQAELDVLKENLRIQENSIRSQSAFSLSTIADEMNQEKLSLAKTTEARIAALRQSERSHLEALHEKYKKVEYAIYQERDKILEQASTEAAPKIEALQSNVGKAQAEHEAHSRSESARRLLQQCEKEAQAAEEQSLRLTDQLEKLTAYRHSLMADYAFPGVEIKEGELWIDGIPFSRVNLSRRFTFAIDLAKRRCGDLDIICMDDFEHLDADSMAAWEVACQKDDAMFIVTRVTEGPLRIRSVVEDDSASDSESPIQEVLPLSAPCPIAPAPAKTRRRRLN